MSTHYAFPPIRVHSERRIDLDEAAKHISEYLTRAEDDASLHPTALLTESGPQTTTSSATNTGLVFHNMQRVAAGLRGERLGPEEIEFGVTNKAEEPLNQSATEQDETGDRKSKKQRNEQDATLEDITTEAEASLTGLAPSKEQSAKFVNGDGDGDGAGADDGTSTADWQDKSEFEREQEVVEGDVGSRDTAAGMRDGAQVPQVKRADKADHKAAKKAKRKQEKREREEAKALAKFAKDAAETEEEEEEEEEEEVTRADHGGKEKDGRRSSKVEKKKKTTKSAENIAEATEEVAVGADRGEEKDGRRSKEEKKKKRHKRKRGEEEES